MKTHPYWRLMRFDKPVGIWLLMWPCWWGVILAGGKGRWDLLLLFLLGAAFMRAAGCVINDIVDRHIDAKVERTRHRPLASGEVSLNEAGLLLFFLLTLALMVAWMLGMKIVLLSAVWLLPVAMYPWMKRITWWPQLFLGLTWNAGALFGWLAVTGEIGLPAVVLHLGAAVWMLGYDTIYAHQDKRDDAKIGIKSAALRLGSRTKPWVLVFYGVFVVMLVLAGWLDQASVWYYPGLVLVAGQLGLQLRAVNLDRRESCLRAFKSNQWTGLLVFMCMILA